MTEFISTYIKEIDQLYQTGATTEHSFRPALQRLLQDYTKLTVVNEQTHIACGAPDLTLFTKNNLAVAYIEAKDLQDSDLDGKKKNKSQFDRYKNALSTIVFTDYLDFHLYEDGVLLDSVAIASIQNGHIILNDSQIGRFQSLMEKLRMSHPQKIGSATKLAKLMAGKARLLADAIEMTLNNDTEHTGSLWNKLDAFKDVLIKDLDEKHFADLYAQTIAYGLFAARIHDKTSNSFSRIEAAELIPKTNPFLRQFFQQIAGFDIEESIKWIVDDLVAIFAATDVQKLRRSMSREQQRRDPMIHFYEDFLQYYDPAAKKQSGVYYTPQPVVEFIVRAVDDILKNDFNLPAGLADISKTEVTIQEMEDGKDVPTERRELRHRVQVLDPATGTGTFLAEVVNCIKEKQQKGAWSAYVDEHLIPRLFGFELMMAPYTIAHLKLDMLINWWGDEALTAQHKERLQIYLTNSLDKTKLVNKKLLAEMIAKEANEANNIKHNTPVMVVIGNPPYNGESQNKSDWIMKLMEDYKKEPNTSKHLKEKNPKWINNDYCKFIRMAQEYVERRGEGIVAYICGNSFLDNPTFRGMRWNLLHTFNKIYIINLHGDSNKKEKSPDGSKDENVFDIMTGTSINIFVKEERTATNELAHVYYSEQFGLRREKLEFLRTRNLSNIKFEHVVNQEPFYLFVPQDFSTKEEYRSFFGIPELFKKNSVGMVSANDELNFSFTIAEQMQKIKELTTMPENEWRQKYNRDKDSRDWSYRFALDDVKKNKGRIIKSAYKPFDIRYTYFTGTTKGLYSFPRIDTMRNIIDGNSIALVASRQCVSDWKYVFVSEFATNLNLTGNAGRLGSGYVFPLYLYEDSFFGEEQPRIPNLDETIWRTIENWVQYGKAFKPLTMNEQNGELGFDAEPEQPHFLAPEDIFDYIYGVLHSPAYRAKYKEFLKVDFPRIPYPKDKTEFEHFRSFGNQLRELHLMHNVPESIVEFPESGSMMVDYAKWDTGWNTDDGYSGRVYINDTQYFDGVPTTAWNFYIGGYQPAQKWLKDRKGRTLSFDDIEHYRKIISVLIETNRLMKEIDVSE